MAEAAHLREKIMSTIAFRHRHAQTAPNVYIAPSLQRNMNFASRATTSPAHTPARPHAFQGFMLEMFSRLSS